MNWQDKVIGDVVSFSGGSQPPKSTFIYEPRDGYIRLIQVRDYKTDKFATYIPLERAQKFCNANDIMIARYGPPIFQILRGLKGAYNVALIKAIPDETQIDREYLYYFLQQEALFLLIDSLSQRSSGQTGIEMDALNNYPLPLPPLEEQRQIAAILSTWDEAIGLVEQLIAALGRRKQALMQLLLTGAVRFPGFAQSDEYQNTEFGRIPTDWLFDSLSTLILSLEAGVSVNSEDRNKLSAELGILKTSAITYGKFDPFEHKTIIPSEEMLASVNPRKDRIIISRMNTINLVGASAYINQDYDDLFLPDRLWQTIPKDKDHSTLWLSYILAWSKMRSAISNIASGTSGSMKNISKSDFLSLRIPIPTYSEQTKIADALNHIDMEIDNLEKQRDCFSKQKRGLMQQLLTGQVRV